MGLGLGLGLGCLRDAAIGGGGAVVEAVVHLVRVRVQGQWLGLGLGFVNAQVGRLGTERREQCPRVKPSLGPLAHAPGSVAIVVSVAITKGVAMLSSITIL